MEALIKLWSGIRNAGNKAIRAAIPSIAVAMVGLTVLLFLAVFSRPAVKSYPEVRVVISEAYDNDGRQVNRTEWIENAEKGSHDR